MGGLPLLMLATLVYGWFNGGTVTPPPPVVIGGAPFLPCPPFGWLITVPHPSLERVTHHGPQPPPWKEWLITVPPSLGPRPLGACYRLVRSPPLGSAGGPPPPEMDDSSLHSPSPQKRMTHQCPLCPPLGVCQRLVWPPPMWWGWYLINGYHVLTLGVSRCMVNERHALIIGMYD